MARIIPSLGLDRDDITHACVTASKRWGWGVFSWHNNEFQARINAKVTGGRCVPVSRRNGDYVIPEAASRAVKQGLGVTT